jgi:hypothetical protein
MSVSRRDTREEDGDDDDEGGGVEVASLVREASANAKLTATVLFPTPPLQEETATTDPTPARPGPAFAMEALWEEWRAPTMRGRSSTEEDGRDESTALAAGSAAALTASRMVAVEDEAGKGRARSRVTVRGEEEEEEEVEEEEEGELARAVCKGEKGTQMGREEGVRPLM